MHLESPPSDPKVAQESQESLGDPTVHALHQTAKQREKMMKPMYLWMPLMNLRLKVIKVSKSWAHCCVIHDLSGCTFISVSSHVALSPTGGYIRYTLQFEQADNHHNHHPDLGVASFLPNFWVANLHKNAPVRQMRMAVCHKGRIAAHHNQQLGSG